MRLIKLKPTNNGSRHQIKLEKSVLLKSTKIFKNVFEYKKFHNGKSSITGHITSWHKGGGKKRLYRKIDFKNEKNCAIQIGASYDPNRSAFTTVNFDFEKKKFFNKLAFMENKPGSLVITNKNINLIKIGYRTGLFNIPMGTLISNISLGLKKKGKLVRSAGTCAQLIQSDGQHARLKLPSNKIVKIPTHSLANIGAISNEKHNLTCLGKAGRNRNLSRRPIVRGIAMNPVDHPHGGRTNGGRPSVTPWGLPCKSKFYLKTRKRKLKLYE